MKLKELFKVIIMLASVCVNTSLSAQTPEEIKNLENLVNESYQSYMGKDAKQVSEDIRGCVEAGAHLINLIDKGYRHVIPADFKDEELGVHMSSITCLSYLEEHMLTAPFTAILKKDPSKAALGFDAYMREMAKAGSIFQDGKEMSMSKFRNGLPDLNKLPGDALLLYAAEQVAIVRKFNNDYAKFLHSRPVAPTMKQCWKIGNKEYCKPDDLKAIEGKREEL